MSEAGVIGSSLKTSARVWGMCRILGSVGRYSELRQYYSELIKGLVGSSEYDPHAVRAFGVGKHSHRDGWGRATIFVSPGRKALYMYKSLSPIFVDKPNQPLPEPELLKHCDPVTVDLIHARAGSRGMPLNYFSVQPFETQTRSGARLILMHNGSVDKDRLAKDLSYRLPDEVLEKYSDTYLLTLRLADLIGDEVSISAIRELSKYTKTALNLGIAVIGEDLVTAVFGSYYRERLPNEHRTYYKIYAARVGDGSIIFTSSTLVDFSEYRPKSLSKWEELPNGTFYFIKIRIKPEEETHVLIEKHSIYS